MLIESILLGVIIGYLRKGKLENLASLGQKKVYLLFIAVFIEFGLNHLLINYNHFISSTGSFSLVMMQYLLILLFIYLNRKQPYVRLIGIGVLLNFIVITANFGAMPVPNRILDLASPSQKISLLKEGKFYTYKLIDQGVLLWLLGDFIRVSFPLRQFISIGDIILAIGILMFIQHAMRMDNKTRAKSLCS